ncbi:MAG: VCBS repeat-containing protein [Theionarchaea archaeon]|nr:VCBS repeat-containing protein [Theionarchaea archaeon]
MRKVFVVGIVLVEVFLIVGTETVGPQGDYSEIVVLSQLLNNEGYDYLAKGEYQCGKDLDFDEEVEKILEEYGDYLSKYIDIYTEQTWEGLVWHVKNSKRKEFRNWEIEITEQNYRLGKLNPLVDILIRNVVENESLQFVKDFERELREMKNPKLRSNEKKILKVMIVETVVEKLLSEGSRSLEGLKKPELPEVFILKCDGSIEDCINDCKAKRKSESKIPNPIYFWVQVAEDIDNPLFRIEAYPISDHFTKYILYFTDEDHKHDRFIDILYDIARAVWHKRIKDIESFYVANGKICFEHIWSNDNSYSQRDSGTHKNGERPYNQDVVIYVSNTWNHAMDTIDTNSKMRKYLVFTDWNEEDDQDNNNETPKPVGWCIWYPYYPFIFIPEKNLDCCTNQNGFGITNSSNVIESNAGPCEIPDEDDFFPDPPGEDHPDDFSGIYYSPVDDPKYYNPYGYEILDYGISILDRGYSTGSYRILTSLKYPSYPLKLFFSPFEVSEKLPILILPSGSLFGLENSFLTKILLELYVENGGTLIVFSQQHGDDYQVLPRGDEINCYGWREDISCNFKSAAIASYDHVFSGQKDVVLDLNVDGFFTKIPEDSIVFLARTRDGTPCLFSYPYGEGKVVVSSLYMDHAYLQGAGTKDEQILLRDMVEWSVHGSPQAFLPDQPIVLSVEAANNSSKTASKIVFSVKNPEKEEVRTIEEKVALDPHQKIEVTLNLNQLSSLGYYIVKCTLLDENSEIIDINENVGAFVVSTLVGDESGYSYIPEFGFAITSETEYYAYNTSAVFTFHIWNRSDQDQNILCRFKLPHHRIGRYWQNPVIREVFAPRGQETTFTYTLPSVHTYDRLWAEFFDENGNFIGAASRGLYGFTPLFEIHVGKDKNSYGRGDTVLISTRIVNKLAYTSPAHLTLVIKNSNGDELYSAERAVWLEGYETKEEIFQFSIPIDIDYGYLKVEVSLPPFFYCDFKDDTILLVRKPTMSLRIDKSNIEHGQVIVEVTNTGEPGINDGVLTVSVDQDGVEFFKESRLFTLAARGSEFLTFNVPLEEGKLSIYKIKAETNYGTVEETEFDARPTIFVSLLSDTLKVTQNLEGIVSVENSMSFSWNLSLEIWINNLDFYEQHQLVLAPYERQEIPFTYVLPSDVLWGSYRTQCRITSEGTSASNSSRFNIIPPVLDALLSGDTFNAGENMDVLVTNSGGYPSEFEFEASLTNIKEDMVLLYGKGSRDIGVDETVTLSFLIPDDLVEGYYLFTFNGMDLELNKPFQIARIVRITGKKAILSVFTSKKIYFTDEDVQCLIDIQCQDGILDGNLLLEILEFTEDVQKDDWWKFRHDLRNTGASSLSSNMEDYIFSWISSPYGDINSSPAIRDINNDGIPDVVLISDEGTVYVLDGIHGLPLWSYETFTYPYNPSSPTLEDVDGDGTIEIILSAEYKVMALTNTGQLKWEFTFNPNPYDPWWFSYIYSSPVIVDLDNDGSKEVIVAAGEDGLFVLAGETGTEIWRVENVFTYSTPAVADLGSDGSLEIVVAHYYGLSVYSNTGTLIWEYAIDSVDGAPVVVDIGGDGYLGIIARDWFGDLYMISEDGVEIWHYSNLPMVESGLTPAVGDLDGDGVPEIVVSADDKIVAVKSDGTLMWELYIGDPYDPYSLLEYFSSSPVLADLNEDGKLDVVVQSENYLCLLDGSSGNIIWSEPGIGTYGSSSPAIADVDGDGKAEIVVCGETGIICCIDSQNGSKKRSSLLTKSGEKVLWSTTVPVSLGESQSINLEYLANIEAEGLLLLRGTLTALNGQTISTDEYYFYIYRGGMAITIYTDREVYWPNEQVQIWGEIINNSQNTREGDLIVSAGDEELLNIPFSLLTGESMPYSTFFVCDSETTAYVTADSITVQKIIHVETPQVLCEIIAPDIVDHNPFKAILKVTNPGERAVSLDVSFEVVP